MNEDYSIGSNLNRNSLFFLVCMALLVCNTAPTVYWGDDGYLVSSLVTFGLGHPPGHPVYMLTEKPFSWLPFGDIAHRISLFSTFAVSLAIVLTGNLLISALNFNKSVRFAALPGMILMLSLLLAHPYVRHQSGRAETYALHLLLLSILLTTALTRPGIRPAFATAFLSGILLGNQLLLAALAGPGLAIAWIMLLKKKVFSLKNIAFSTVFFILGCSVYIYLPIRSRAKPAVQWDDIHRFQKFLDYATAKTYQSQFFMDGKTIGGTRLDHLLLLKEKMFATFGFNIMLLSLAGFALAMLHRRMRYFIVLIVGVTTAFGSIYCQNFELSNWDFQGYLLPFLVLIAITAGLFLNYLVGLKERQTYLISSVALVLAVTPLVQIPGLNRISPLPECTYARLCGISFLETAPPSAIIFTRSDLVYILKYLQTVERYRTDITLISMNKLIRSRNQAFLSREYPDVFFPPSAMKDMDSWIRNIMLSNKNSRPVAYELSDKQFFGASNTFRLNGALVYLSGHPEQTGGRNYDFFMRFIKDGARIRNDHNAIEQVRMILYNRGTYLLKRNRSMEALKTFQTACRLDSTDPRIFNNLGVAAANLGKFGEAKTAFERAIRIDPDYQGAKQNINALERMIK